MRRKIVKQGIGGCTIFLPIEWVRENNLKAGDEVDINHVSNSLVISTEKVARKSSISIDVSEMDRTALVKTVIAYYEMGYSEIKVSSRKNTVYDPWHKTYTNLGKEVDFLVSRLIGFEVISSSNNNYTIKDVGLTSPEEFNPVLRRIFFLLLEFHDKIKESVKKDEHIENPEMLHDTITKFVSFCLRLLNLNIKKTEIEKNNFHTIITLLDKTTDSLRYLAHDINKGIKIKNKKLIFEIMEYFADYYAYFYDGDIKIVNRLDVRRQKIRVDLAKSSEVVIANFASILEYVQAMIKPRISLNEISLS